MASVGDCCHDDVKRRESIGDCCHGGEDGGGIRLGSLVVLGRGFYC